MYIYIYILMVFHPIVFVPGDFVLIFFSDFSPCRIAGPGSGSRVPSIYNRGPRFDAVATLPRLILNLEGFGGPTPFTGVGNTVQKNNIFRVL